MGPTEGQARAAGPLAEATGDTARGLVASIRRLAVHDGPGIRTIVFMKGCPLRCVWCAAPETQLPGREILHYPERCLGCELCRQACPEGAIAVASDADRRIDRSRCTLCGRCVEACAAEALQMPAREMSAAEVLAEVERDRMFYRHSGGGVTISGGEPLMQPAFTSALLRSCRQAGLHTAMETSGLQSWEVFAATLVDLDLLLYDLKLMDPEAHRQYTGASNERILENLERAVARGIPTVVRIPVIPGFTDQDSNILAMRQLLRGIGPIRRIDLLPYHRLGEAMYARLGREYALSLPLVTDERLEHVAGLLQAAGFVVQVGG